MRATDTIPAQVVTDDGRTHRAIVGDITANGVRLIGPLPVAAGDEVRLGISIDQHGDPFNTAAIVTSYNPGSTGARFIR